MLDQNVRIREHGSRLRPPYFFAEQGRIQLRQNALLLQNDGRDIPDHDTNPDFEEPVLWWTPVISAAHLMVYSGDAFPEWHGDLLAAGLSSRAIIRIRINGDNATEVERFPMGAPIRSVVQGPQGALWVLEDESREGEGRLLKLTPTE